MTKQLALMALLALLGGCSLMPDYERPATPVPSAWPEGIKLKATTRLGIADWHHYFPDPRLQVLIATALENNRDLRIATARIAEARGQYGIQSADRFPNFNVTGSRTASRTPASASSTGSVAVQAQRYDVAVTLVSYELDFWGRVSSMSAFAKASYLATEAAQQAFRLSLVADVANAYLSLLELRERAGLAADILQAGAITKELVSRRREVGVSSEMDYLLAESVYQKAVADLSNLEQQQAAAENLLNLLLGQPMSEIGNLPVGRSLSDQGITPDHLVGLPAEVLLKRPDVLAAEHKLIAANANIGAARAAFLPRITLVGNAGTASRTLGGLFDAGSGAWSFQPAISIPLFSAGRGSSNLDIAEARKEIAVAEYEKAIQQSFREVADLLSASDKLTEQFIAQEAISLARSERLRLVEARFKAGVVSQLEVLEAQRDAYTAKQSATQARRVWLTVATQLYKALAGESNDTVERVSQEIASKKWPAKNDR